MNVESQENIDLFIETRNKHLHIFVINVLFILDIYRPKTKLPEGNVFTPVCHSVHRGRVSLPPGMVYLLAGGGGGSALRYHR